MNTNPEVYLPSCVISFSVSSFVCYIWIVTSCINSTTISCAHGLYSDDLRTTVFPQISGMSIALKLKLTGAFHGAIDKLNVKHHYISVNIKIRIGKRHLHCTVCPSLHDNVSTRCVGTRKSFAFNLTSQRRSLQNRACRPSKVYVDPWIRERCFIFQCLCKLYFVLLRLYEVGSFEKYGSFLCSRCTFPWFERLSGCFDSILLGRCWCKS